MPDQNSETQTGQGPGGNRVSDQLNERTKEIGQQQQQGQPSGEAVAPARENEDGQGGPSNSGDAGFRSSGTEAQNVSGDRIEQMSHADGSDDEPNPDV